MKSSLFRVLKKTIKVIVISIVSLLLILFLLPYIMPGTISQKIKTFVNRSIDGKIEFSKARLSFFNHFPSLTLTLYDFSSTGSAPFQNEKLLSAGEIAMGIRIPALLRGEIKINEFYISNADVNIHVNEKGEANYNVYKSSASSDTSSSADTTTALKLEKIVIEKSNLVYNDLSSAVLIKARQLNYTGKGDLSKAIFDLTSHIAVDSFDFYYDQEPYILKRRIRADLVTSINTNSLAFEFRNNKLRINRLPIECIGRYEFLKKGYKMNFEFKSVNAELGDIFTVLPPSYQGWLGKTRMQGSAALQATLSGMYIGGTDTMPSMAFDMKIRNGYIAYDKAPVPLRNLYIDFGIRLPALNPDSVSVNIDSVSFNMGKNYFSSVLKIKGYQSPQIFASINSELDLQEVDRALGLVHYDMKGKLTVKLNTMGRFATGQNPGRLRNDIVVTSIPSFSFQSSLQNGYFHFTALPQPIRQINFTIRADCPDNNYRHISASVDDIDVRVLNNYLKGFIRLKNAENFPVDANLDAVFRLSDIKQFYPLDSTDFSGNLVMNIKSNGNYQPAKKIFPQTEATLKVENASLQTKYYPAPIEKIAVEATIKNKKGTLRDLQVKLQPVSFEFEGKPFMVKADLQDFDNLRYDIVSKGEGDLGKIYKVFSQQGWDVRGTITTDLSLHGNQGDAAAGRYSRLQNSGTLKVNKLLVVSYLYPLPFYIDKGILRFDQDRINFDQFRATYGKSSVVLSGSVSNLFNYVSGRGPLKGDLHLQSDYLLLDELMAYHADTVSSRPDSLAAGSSGVIMVPNDLDLKFSADVKLVDYNKLHIDSVNGEVLLKDGQVKMNQTGLKLGGASTVMDGDYRTLSPARALFNYHVKMNDFDVQRMYKEVELFRQLAPSAAKAQGIVAVDYNLEGKLNGDMYPIMPSLKGGGVVSVKNVKVKGLKFFSSVSKETGKQEINDPDLSKINFKTSIKNNVVTLEKTKIKVAGFRLRLQGQTDFDGHIKFNCRVGLPPFGIIGIPVKVTGTGQQPVVKTGKTDRLPLAEQKEEDVEQ
ncbi:MAG: AsmA family protein [Bacteroidetes bacterium]|nr:MAG: AsmA family protein [Bacteroidota bacterium]